MVQTCRPRRPLPYQVLGEPQTRIFHATIQRSVVIHQALGSRTLFPTFTAMESIALNFQRPCQESRSGDVDNTVVALLVFSLRLVQDQYGGSKVLLLERITIDSSPDVVIPSFFFRGKTVATRLS